MSEGYRYERTTWTDGTGETHDVVKFYVPDDDDDWMTCDLLPDGACLRLWSRGPVYMRSASPSYPSIEAAVAEVKSAHMDWLATDRDGWRQAIGVLAQEGAGETGQASDDVMSGRVCYTLYSDSQLPHGQRGGDGGEGGTTEERN